MAHTLKVMAMRPTSTCNKSDFGGVQAGCHLSLVFSVLSPGNLMFTAIVDIRICWKISVKKLTKFIFGTAIYALGRELGVNSFVM